MTIKNWDFSVEHGHFSNFGGALSFVIFWWSTVMKNLRKLIIIENWLIDKFDKTSLARVHGTSKHGSCYTSLFNPKGNHRLPQAPNFFKEADNNENYFLARKTVRLRHNSLQNTTIVFYTMIKCECFLTSFPLFSLHRSLLNETLTPSI